MTQETIGARIAKLRKQQNLTQDALAEKLNVSPQAVSKWENDVSCPDISLLPKLAKTLNVTTDMLLSGEEEPEVRVIPAEKRKNFDEMMLRIYITDGKDQENVRISVPLALLRIALDSGIQPTFSMNSNSGVSIFSSEKNSGALHGIDFHQIMQLVESGVIGTLMEVDTSDGTRVRIVVE